MPTNDCPADLAKQIKQWLGPNGRENTASLLLYEAMQMLERCASHATPVELSGIADVLKKGNGAWRTCTGCYETEDGHPVGQYAHSDTLGCPLGSGCNECGGIGAVWDNTDYEEMAEFMMERDRLRAAGIIDLSDSQLLDVLDQEITERNLRWVAKNEGHPCVGTVSGSERHGVRDAIRALLVLMRGCMSPGGAASGAQKYPVERGADERTVMLSELRAAQNERRWPRICAEDSGALADLLVAQSGQLAGVVEDRALKVLRDLSLWVAGMSTWRDGEKGPYLRDIITDARDVLASLRTRQEG